MNTSLQKMASRFLLLFLLWNCFTDFGSVAQLLPLQEVKALETISEKFQIRDWNVNRSFCNGSSLFQVTVQDDIYRNITCSCNNTVCHITNIQLKGQNLNGNIPEELANLSFLQEIDFSRNYLNGSIPVALFKLPLTILSLLGNRISGSIPKEMGDLDTLEELVLADNLLTGSLHQNLGRLSSLRRLLLSGNNFTGSIPGTFSKLTNLESFRIDGTSLSGKIPDLIGNWTKITNLQMQGTSMEGPIPSTISKLENITELMISDLRGSNMKFPDIKGMMKLKTLILRNCSITGTIPDYIGPHKELKILDLSFNLLTGPIPATLQSSELDFMLLSNNSLSGAVPNWIISNQNKIDISYNNFTESPPYGCLSSSVNVISSISAANSNSVEWCLKRGLPCSKKPKYHSLFINCGGGQTSFEGNEYVEDMVKEGPSYFFAASSQKWAYSSTGLFIGKREDSSYRASNKFDYNITGADFYQTARLSPGSLKYYGLCMRKGSYRVRLHFAEIMYSNNQTFTSLGKRIFDVAIQGNVVLTDFNIVEEAKGVGKGIVKDFNVLVNGSTLEIHLFWTGKGTTSVPDKGIYGPLISAITVTPNFDPRTGLSVRAIVGIILGAITGAFILLGLILFLLWRKGYIGNKDLEDRELRALDLQTGFFSLRQLKVATNNFDPANKIGEGGFGPVYKGTLSDGAVIAVKQLSAKSKQGNREFVNEIGMISALQHPNLVKLYGCCIEGNQLLLIYEYMENNSLAGALFGREEQRIMLNWSTRKNICLGIAKGLAYLHEESRLKIVHRDIKATNVLLDKDLSAKISDFGLAKLNDEENTHISTRIAGTIGYMAPEYAMRGYLTDKADVYSFGIVALEIVSGKSNTNYRPKAEFVYLLDWAYVLQEQGSLLELVDPDLGTNYSKKEALNMLNIGLLCSNPSPTLRPSMSSVVGMLEGKSPIQAPIIKRNHSREEEMMRFKAFERMSQDSHSQSIVSASSQEDSQVQKSMCTDPPSLGSSVSARSTIELTDPSSSKLLPDASEEDALISLK